MNAYYFTLTPEQAQTLEGIIRSGNYILREMPYTIVAFSHPASKISGALYTSGKLAIQGKGAQDFVQNIIEPQVLRRVLLEEDGTLAVDLSAEALSPHIGVDESGKGDFFGPLAVAAVYTDATLAEKLKRVGAQDSKSISSDTEALRIAAAIRTILGPQHYSILLLQPPAYNRLYSKMRSINRILAWGHARCIENVLTKVPSCPMAISDQFGKEDTVRRALMERGKAIELRSRTRAEADIAVAAASILAREAFLSSLAKMEEAYKTTFPKGSTHILDVANLFATLHEPKEFLNVAKCHFSTLDKALARSGHTRMDMPPEGQIKSTAFNKK